MIISILFEHRLEIVSGYRLSSQKLLHDKDLVRPHTVPKVAGYVFKCQLLFFGQNMHVIAFDLRKEPIV